MIKADFKYLFSFLDNDLKILQILEIKQLNKLKSKYLQNPVGCMGEGEFYVGENLNNFYIIFIN